jgi:hypothetical protein
MSKFIEKAPKILAYILVLVSAVIVGLVYFGGIAESIEVGGDLLPVPVYTDTLIYWSYFLLGLTLFITLAVTLLGFVKGLIDNPMKAIKGLIPIVAFILIFVVAWFLGSDEKMSIIGYEGSDNFGFWAQFIDMVIYSIYAMFAAIILVIFGAKIYTSQK